MFDHEVDAAVLARERQADPHAVLILDGIFLHRSELRRAWDFSIFLRVGFDVSVPRGAARRGGVSPDPLAHSNRRYLEGQRLYLREAQPWLHATVVVDNTDLAAPAIFKPEQARLDRDQ